MIDLVLQKTLGGFKLDASCTLAASGFSVLLGPSGCGKTTLSSCLAGLLRPDRGLIRVNGKTS
ncbi:MAG: ATP-binding cassette domain-containing protein, partial [Duodenibacillus sp.]